jgi:plasmid maintenance system antidote protein VapI
MGEAITVTALAGHLGVARAHLSMILNGRAGVSPLLSVKLDEAFNKSDGSGHGCKKIPCLKIAA